MRPAWNSLRSDSQAGLPRMTHPALSEPEGEEECLWHSPLTPGPSPSRGEGSNPPCYRPFGCLPLPLRERAGGEGRTRSVPYPLWLAEWKPIGSEVSGPAFSIRAGRYDCLERRHRRSRRDRGYASLGTFLSYNKKVPRLSGRDRTRDFQRQTGKRVSKLSVSALAAPLRPLASRCLIA